jgi:Fe2+ or Zn2+ uptake regulation protein
MNKTNRETKQRAAIKAALDKAGRPLNVNEILTEAQGIVPNLGIATVYRNVKTMVERGEIKPVNGMGIPPCYAIPEVAQKCAATRYQTGTSLHVAEPKGFVCESACKIFIGAIA